MTGQTGFTSVDRGHFNLRLAGIIRGCVVPFKGSVEKDFLLVGGFGWVFASLLQVTMASL